MTGLFPYRAYAQLCITPATGCSRVTPNKPARMCCVFQRIRGPTISESGRTTGIPVVDRLELSPEYWESSHRMPKIMHARN
jgi:hypothetical protein